MKQIRRMLAPFALISILLSLFYVSHAYASLDSAQHAAIITATTTPTSTPTSCQNPQALDVY